MRPLQTIVGNAHRRMEKRLGDGVPEVFSWRGKDYECLADTLIREVELAIGNYIKTETVLLRARAELFVTSIPDTADAMDPTCDATGDGMDESDFIPRAGDSLWFRGIERRILRDDVQPGKVIYAFELGDINR